MEVSASGGGFAKSTKEYLHWFYANFEHRIGCGGGSGDSGGIFSTLVSDTPILMMLTSFKLNGHLYFSRTHLKEPIS